MRQYMGRYMRYNQNETIQQLDIRHELAAAAGGLRPSDADKHGRQVHLPTGQGIKIVLRPASGIW